MPEDKMPQEAGLTRFPLTALIMRYTSQRRRRGEIADNTARKIAQVLGQFAEVAPADVRKINEAHVRAFIERYNRSPSTARGHLSVIRTFLRWCVMEGYVKRDATIGIKPPAMPPSVPGALTVDKSEALHRTVGTLEPRVRLMLCLEKNEGLRRVELHRAQIGDIDRRGRTIRVRGKAEAGAVMSPASCRYPTRRWRRSMRTWRASPASSVSLWPLARCFDPTTTHTSPYTLNASACSSRARSKTLASSKAHETA
jgi:site-specific recombinase XerD